MHFLAILCAAVIALPMERSASNVVADARLNKSTGNLPDVDTDVDTADEVVTDDESNFENIGLPAVESTNDLGVSDVQNDQSTEELSEGKNGRPQNHDPFQKISIDNTDSQEVKVPDFFSTGKDTSQETDDWNPLTDSYNDHPPKGDDNYYSDEERYPKFGYHPLYSEEDDSDVKSQAADSENDLLFDIDLHDNEAYDEGMDSDANPVDIDSDDEDLVNRHEVNEPKQHDPEILHHYRRRPMSVTVPNQVTEAEDDDDALLFH
jgi:hypothetical protein